MQSGAARARLNGVTLDRLRIPARCPHCGAAHSIYYRWLRGAGGFQCPACRLVAEIDLQDIDAAMDSVDAAMESLNQAVGRLAVRAWRASPP